MKKDISKIPKGFYCYDENGICPYWDLKKELPSQENGYCYYLEESDVDLDVGLLWDQVKECGINEPSQDELDKEFNNDD